MAEEILCATALTVSLAKSLRIQFCTAGLLLLFLSTPFPGHASSPPRAFDACAGPPLPHSLSQNLAKLKYYESDPLGPYLSGMQEQRRYH